jgi:hypothetical protein
MRQIVKLNWKIRDFVNEEQSFSKWHRNVFKCAPPSNSFDKKRRIEIRDQYHKQMKKYGSANGFLLELKQFEI